ncbi:MAG: hypothetical protein IPQ06_09495 [Chitinophagaceae bacterium]|nr:hypothetical protein [Chitinophagaceae bacterium]
MANPFKTLFTKNAQLNSDQLILKKTFIAFFFFFVFAGAAFWGWKWLRSQSSVSGKTSAPYGKS